MRLDGTAGLGATWPGDKRLGAPGRVRPPAREDALGPAQGAVRRGTLHHKPRGTIVAGVPPRSDAALWSAGLMAGKTPETPNRAPPWPGDKRLGAPGRVRPPPWEDALAPYLDAQRQSTLHHKPRGPIGAGVHPRPDAALCCAGFKDQEGRGRCCDPAKTYPAHGKDLVNVNNQRIDKAVNFNLSTCGRVRTGPRGRGSGRARGGDRRPDRPPAAP